MGTRDLSCPRDFFGFLTDAERENIHVQSESGS
jgi:hypothetical protein